MHWLVSRTQRISVAQQREHSWDSRNPSHSARIAPLSRPASSLLSGQPRFRVLLAHPPSGCSKRSARGVSDAARFGGAARQAEGKGFVPMTTADVSWLLL